MKCLRACIDKMQQDISPEKLFDQSPTIYFEPESRSCEKCATTLTVQKTRLKTIVTMDIGKFHVVETILKCPEDGTIHNSETLRSLAPYKATFGFDVMAYVGEAALLRNRSELEIIKELAAANVVISEREIAYLTKKFVLYLAIAHRESRQPLKDLMNRQGGYILHLDGTCEGDSPHLFTGIDGISGLILANVKLPSEKAELIIPFLEQMKEQYGEPIAMVHDMGKGILTAVKSVLPDVPDFICHFHFLRDIGKDLLEQEYAHIRNGLKKYKIRTFLRQKAKDLKGEINEPPKEEFFENLQQSIENGAIEPELLPQLPVASAYLLIQWAFNFSEELNGYGFPFDRPHLLLYQRLKVVHSVLRQVLNYQLTMRFGSKFSDTPPGNLHYSHSEMKKNFRLWRLLDDVCGDRELEKSAQQLEQKIIVFDRLRQTLSITLPEGNLGLNDEGQGDDIRTIEKGVENFREWITGDEQFAQEVHYKKMVQQIDKYWQKLFADAIVVSTQGEGEKIIQPQRTNNVMERLFRDFKRSSRKRNGMLSLSKTLKTMLADTTLVKNLENEEYLNIILSGSSTIAERFSKIDNNIVLQELRRLQNRTERIHPTVKAIVKIPDLPQTLNEIFDTD